MHIPDNYLSPSTCAALGAMMLPVWRRASRKVKEELTRKKLPLLGIGAAFSFLIMMFNLPLPGGTTGHAVGAALLAILIGPYGAVISVTVALGIQALLFGDGGILAFGANAFNMAFVMPFAAHYIYQGIKGSSQKERVQYIAAFIAGYVALNIAALLTAIEFGIQPMLFQDAAGVPLYAPYSLNIAVPAMMIPHLLAAGFIEGIVTVGVYAYVKKLSPEAIYEGKTTGHKPLYGLLAGMILLSPLGLLATGTAWGEWGTDEIKGLLGYIPKAMEQGFQFEAIMPDYVVSGIGEISGYMVSAAIGVLIILGSLWLFNRRIEKVVKE